MNQSHDDERIVDEALKNVPQDIWDIVEMCRHAVRQTDEAQFEIEIAQIGQAIRRAGAARASTAALDRGAEPFWIQDVRIAQRRIEAQRISLQPALSDDSADLL